MRCSGACCERFTLRDSGGRLATLVTVQQSDDTNLRPFRSLARLVRPGNGMEPFDVLTCSALNAEKRCTMYELRPQTCRRYPDEFPCPYCGATSDSEARDAEPVDS